MQTDTLPSHPHSHCRDTHTQPGTRGANTLHSHSNSNICSCVNLASGGANACIAPSASISLSEHTRKKPTHGHQTQSSDTVGGGAPTHPTHTANSMSVAASTLPAMVPGPALLLWRQVGCLPHANGHEDGTRAPTQSVGIEEERSM